MTEATDETLERTDDETAEAGDTSNEPYTVSEDQRRGARRTALFFVGLVLLLSIITALSRMLGW